MRTFHLLLAIVCAAILVSCPAKDGAKQKQGQTTSDQSLTEYIRYCLDNPATDTTPPLAKTWKALSVLDTIPDDESLFNACQKSINDLADNSPHQLVVFGMRTQPEKTTNHLIKWISEGKFQHLGAMRYSEAGISDVLELLNWEEDAGQAATHLMPALVDMYNDAALKEPARPLIEKLAALEDPMPALPAIGMLMHFGWASEEQEDRLKDAVRSMELEKNVWASEGVRIAADPALAASYTDIFANLYDATAENADSRIHYALYGLSSVGGEQAKLFRRRVLGSADPQVRWMARLGALLNDDPDPWLSGVVGDDITAQALWVVLETRHQPNSDLLLLYRKVVEEGPPELHVAVAAHLRRCEGTQFEDDAAKLLHKLIESEETATSEQAWYALGQIGSGGKEPAARRIMEDESMPPSVRLACNFYLLNLREE